MLKSFAAKTLIALTILMACAEDYDPFTDVDPDLLARASTMDSGLKYIDITIGEGPSPELGETVTVHYVGELTDGTVFDSSIERDEPFEFILGSVNIIEGWYWGVRTMGVGGERILIIPPDLGYGAQGVGSVIPPYATLIFTITLLAIG